MHGNDSKSKPPSVPATRTADILFRHLQKAAQSPALFSTACLSSVFLPLVPKKKRAAQAVSMAASSSPSRFLFFLNLASFLLAVPSAVSAACSKTFSNNRVYDLCADLPTLNTTLHWTYTAANSSLSIAFVASPASSSGWVSWGINPTAKAMIGSQALLAYRLSNGSVAVNTYNISGYTNIVPSAIAYDVPYKEAEYADGVITIFATLSLPASAVTTVNHVWQVGPGMNGTSPQKHALEEANKKATGSLDFLKGGSSNGTTSGGGSSNSSDSRPSAADVAARFSSPFLISSAALVSLLVAAVA